MPEGALINYGVTEGLELVFETLRTSRKYRNLQSNPHAAFVMGWQNECLSCQYDGVVDELSERGAESLLDIYFAARPEGLGHRDWPNLTYLRARPRWVRISNYNLTAWNVEEILIL